MLLTVEASYVMSMIFLKLSLGVFFFRIMVLRWQQICVHLILICSISMAMAYFFFILFWCGFPVDAHTYWASLIANKCAPVPVTLGMSYAHSVLTAATDLSLLLLPIPVLLRLHMRRNEKWAVVSIFFIATL
jgi:hypothetical protein